MSDHGKSQSQQKQLNWYGTLSGAIAWRLDWITAIIYNGNYIWQCDPGGPLDLTGMGVVNADGYVDLTGGVLDPTLFIEGGYLRLYPGVPTAVQNLDLEYNSAYRDRARLDAKGIFFGTNSGTAPNLQVIGGAKPVAPITIVADADNIVDDRQVNPIACLAEFLLDERGAGMLEAQLDAPSWLATAHYWAQDQAHRDYSFISPLLTEQLTIREIVRRWLEPLSAFLRWTPEGKLGCFMYEWGTDPGGLLTIDARHFTEGKSPKIRDIDWIDIPTALNVSFTDRGYEFQNNNIEVPNQRAADIRQIDDPQNLARPDVTRGPQAQKHGAEWFRRISGKATLFVRGPVVAGLQPGDKIKFDDDPEPGGAGAAQIARVDRIETDRTDEATLEITIDPLLPATVYTPAWISPLPEDLFPGAVQSAPSLAYMQALPLPPQYFGWPPAVGFVATRPSGEIAGFHAYFATNPAAAFAELGAQVGFAARCSLVNPVIAGDGTLRLQLLDGAAGHEAYLAAGTPGGNVAQAEDNTLLAVLIALDGSGRVDVDGSGEPIMEFASILQRAAVSSTVHDYTVYRGRCTLAARGWGAATAVWIVPRANLVAWRHELFTALFGAIGYFRLASFTSAAVDETVPLPETQMKFPSAYAADLPAEYSIVLTSETIAVACDNAGTPLAGQLGVGGTTNTTVTVLRAGTPLTAVAAGGTADQFSISIFSITNCTATKETNSKVRADTLTANQGVIAIDVLVGGAFTVRKTLTLSKVRKGDTGAAGTPGADGIDGTNGLDGPGAPFIGPFAAGTNYFYIPGLRRDVVSYGGGYYATDNAAKSGGHTWDVPGTSGDWLYYGATLRAVATALLLAEDATITKTLTIGTAGSDHGIIQSANYVTSGGTAGWQIKDDGTAIFRLGSTGIFEVGSGVNRVLIDNTGVLHGLTGGSDPNIYITDDSGAPGLLFRVGISLKGKILVNSSGVFAISGSGASTAQITSFDYISSSEMHSFSSSNPHTSSAPLSTDGGCWVGADIDVRGVARLNGGSAGSPALAIDESDTNTGLYSDEADKLKVTAGGVQIARFVRSGGSSFLIIESGGIFRIGSAKTAITSETVSHFVTAEDNAGTTIKLAILT